MRGCEHLCCWDCEREPPHPRAESTTWGLGEWPLEAPPPQVPTSPSPSRCSCLGYFRVCEADITKYHKLGDFNHRHRFFHHPGGQKSRGSAPSEGPEGRVRPGISPWLAVGSLGPMALQVLFL